MGLTVENHLSAYEYFSSVVDIQSGSRGLSVETYALERVPGVVGVFAVVGCNLFNARGGRVVGEESDAYARAVACEAECQRLLGGT